jgi:hypothetical protein
MKPQDGLPEWIANNWRDNPSHDRLHMDLFTALSIALDVLADIKALCDSYGDIPIPQSTYAIGCKACGAIARIEELDK